MIKPASAEMRSADPNVLRRRDFAQNQTARSKRSHETSEHCGAEERKTRHAAVIVTGLGVASGPNVPTSIVTTEKMPGDGADERKHQAQG